MTQSHRMHILQEGGYFVKQMHPHDHFNWLMTQENGVIPGKLELLNFEVESHYLFHRIARGLNKTIYIKCPTIANIEHLMIAAIFCSCSTSIICTG